MPHHCAPAALALALLFAWMKLWQSLFMERVTAVLSLTPPPRRTMAGLGQTILVQSVVQPTGWLILPLAMVLTFPFAWVFAFYQHLSLTDGDPGEDIRAAVNRAVRDSRIWPRQNHLLILIWTAFSAVVFLNILIGLFTLPYLLKTLFGFDTVFTLTWRTVFNTTYLAVCLGLTYLCVDPLIKTGYALRSFFAESIKTGEDLNVELRRLDALRKTALTVLLGVILITAVFCPPATAGPTPDKPGGETKVVADLDAAIKSVLERPEFSWRLPRDHADHDRPDIFNPFAAFFRWVKPIVKTAVSPLVDRLKPLVKRFIDWLRQQTRINPSEKKTSRDIDWMGWIKLLLFLLLCVFGGLLGVYAKRLWVRRRRTHRDVDREPESAPPDLDDENIDAADRDADQWLTLARDLAAAGNLRQALRAVYLATLAHLAEKGVIQIARHKSNRDYAAELRRRLHENREAQNIFTANVNFFDRVWYGMHAVDQQDIESFTVNHGRIVSSVYGQ